MGSFSLKPLKTTFIISTFTTMPYPWWATFLCHFWSSTILSTVYLSLSSFFLCDFNFGNATKHKTTTTTNQNCFIFSQHSVHDSFSYFSQIKFSVVHLAEKAILPKKMFQKLPTWYVLPLPVHVPVCMCVYCHMLCAFVKSFLKLNKRTSDIYLKWWHGTQQSIQSTQVLSFFFLIRFVLFCIIFIIRWN